MEFDIKSVETAEQIEKKILQCFESREVEAIFEFYKVTETPAKIHLLQKTMGITGVDFFNPTVDDDIKYEALLVSFESQEWRFYR